MAKDFYKRAIYLEYFTVGYNILEGALSILAGFIAGSVALIGFGVDSAIESISGGILLWRLVKHGSVSADEERTVEKNAVRFVGYSFFLLGAYVLIEAVKKLYFHEAPEPSLPGIIIAVLSLLTMPVLAMGKHRVAREIASKSLEADSKQTLICAILSLALLFGLWLNYSFGVWWADPAAALVITAFIFMEGYETLEETED